MQTNDFLNYIENKKAIIILNGVEYKLNKSAKVSLIINALNKELEKNKKEKENFDELKENMDLVEKVIKLVGGEELFNAIDEMELDELNYIKTFNLIMSIRSGKTIEEASEDYNKTINEENKKKD